MRNRTFTVTMYIALAAAALLLVAGATFILLTYVFAKPHAANAAVLLANFIPLSLSVLSLFVLAFALNVCAKKDECNAAEDKDAEVVRHKNLYIRFLLLAVLALWASAVTIFAGVGIIGASYWIDTAVYGKAGDLTGLLMLVPVGLLAGVLVGVGLVFRRYANEARSRITAQPSLGVLQTETTRNSTDAELTSQDVTVKDSADADSNKIGE